MIEGQTVNTLLQQGLKQFALQRLCEPLTEYVFLLNKWNQTYNLTSIRDPLDMVGKHILDSLAINPWIKAKRILDVGTGAGLPGIPLALANSDCHWVLLDSNGKKIRFLHEAKRQLALDNLEIVQFRVENYHPPQAFDTVLSRAFSSLNNMMSWTQHLIAPTGIWLAMKGKDPIEELRETKHLYRIKNYTVEGLSGERCCILIQNTNKE